MDAAAHFLILFAALALASRQLGGTGRGLALALFAAIGGCVVLGLARHHPHRRFGAANLVTAARAAAAAFLLGLWAEAATGAIGLSDGVRWMVAGVVAAALAADGLDGWLARRLGQASGLGARFDMETDALMVLALALLTLAAGQAGQWVVASGALRYGFVAAGFVLPALRAPLPPSRRRQAICVAQSLVLVAAISPALAPAWAQALAAVGLGLLVYSFAVDCVGCCRSAARSL